MQSPPAYTQNGRCEFGANDEGWESFELEMEIGCGPNGAWSILSSSQGLVWPAGTHFVFFFWLQVSRHFGVPECLMGTKSPPTSSSSFSSSLPSFPSFNPDLEGKKKSIWMFSQKVACIITSHALNGAGKMLCFVVKLAVCTRPAE